MTAKHTLTAILQRANRLVEQKTDAQKRLAYWYAAKAGYPKADGYLMHCLHNWTLGNGSEAGNEFAKKAVHAWFTAGNGGDRFVCNVYKLALAKGIR